MKHRAFTLFEVAIVLVLIVGAATLFYPVFFRARESGGPRDYCMSNLKQIGLGLKQYIQDYDEKYPPSSAEWPAVAQPYLKSWMIFQCPLDSSASRELTTDYFLNARLLGAQEKNIVALNQTILAGDGLSNCKSATLSQLPAAWISDSNAPAWRHPNGANYLFADGGVKRLQPEQITLDEPAKGKPTFSIR